jgi:hypothetical protein
MSQNTGKLAAKRKRLREAGFSHEQANLLLKYGAKRYWSNQRLQYEAEYMTELNAPFEEVMESLVGYSGMEKYWADLAAQEAERAQQERIAAGKLRDFPHANNAEELIEMAKNGTLRIGPERRSLEELTDSEWDVVMGYTSAKPEYEGGDHALGAIYEARGYHAKPELMSSEDLTNYVNDNNVPEMWRGVGSNYWIDRSQGDEAARTYYSRQLQSGEAHWPGKGVYGNGTYTAYGMRNNANHYTEALGMARACAGGPDGSVTRMALRPDARIANYSHIESEASKARYRIKNEYNSLFAPSHDAPMAERVYYETQKRRLQRAMDLFSDEGRVAALMGYDAIDVADSQTGPHQSNFGSVRYMVVYNRGALVMDNHIYTVGEVDAIRERASNHEPQMDWLGQ